MRSPILLAILGLIAGPFPVRAQQTPIPPIYVVPPGAPAAAGPTFPRQRIRPPEECVGVVAPTDGRPGDSLFAPPTSTVMVVPPASNLPDQQRERTVAVRFHVSETGSITAVDLAGVVDSEYAKTFRANLMGYRFQPAIFHGCRVAATSIFHMTFGGPNGRQPVGPTPTILVSRNWPQMTQSPWTQSTADPLPPASAFPATCDPHRPAFGFGEWPDPKSAGANGAVVLRFVIDSTGLPVDSTVRVVQTSSPKLAAAVRKSFPTLRYTPAWCDGHAVAADVQQLFVFGH